jgi:hypothetical protein
VKGSRSVLAGHDDAVFDQRTSNPMPPDGWLDEQGVQFGVSIGPRQESGKSGTRAVWRGSPIRHCCTAVKRVCVTAASPKVKVSGSRSLFATAGTVTLNWYSPTKLGASPK